MILRSMAWSAGHDCGRPASQTILSERRDLRLSVRLVPPPAHLGPRRCHWFSSPCVPDEDNVPAGESLERAPEGCPTIFIRIRGKVVGLRLPWDRRGLRARRVSAPGGHSPIRIGTRGSRLALWQAQDVATRLSSHRPEVPLSASSSRRSGIGSPTFRFPRIGGKGLFTKELDSALLARGDRPCRSQPQGPSNRRARGARDRSRPRARDPRDVLISASGGTLVQLPVGSRVGTSSLRRRSQLLALRSDLRILDLRGNVPTRIEKLERGQYEAIVLASAGVKRLGLEPKVTEVLGADRLLSAVGQGAIAVMVRSATRRRPTSCVCSTTGRHTWRPRPSAGCCDVWKGAARSRLEPGS